MRARSIVHWRRQWSVGQGGFHTASLLLNNGIGGPESRFRYVFDCGSVSPRSYLRTAIEAYLDGLGSNRLIDAVFLSHVDEDHINGLPQLAAGAQIRRIFVPLLTPVERLALLCQSEVGVSSFGADFIANPPAAIRSLDYRIEVVRVRPGKGPADAGDGQVQGSLDPDDELPTNSVVGRPGSWTQIGRHQRRMEDDAVIRLDGSLGTAPWILALYVERHSSMATSSFRRALASQFGINPGDLDGWLRPSRIHELVTNKAALASLRRAYQIAAVDINRSSMVLVSGPGWGSTEETIRLGDRISTSAPRSTWLLTGDANFSSVEAVDEMQGHFGSRLDGLAVVALPHHGSIRNFSSALLTATTAERPLLAFAAAGLSHALWRHPDAMVVKRVSSAGVLPWAVTEEPSSTLEAFASE